MILITHISHAWYTDIIYFDIINFHVFFLYKREGGILLGSEINTRKKCICQNQAKKMKNWLKRQMKILSAILHFDLINLKSYNNLKF